MDSSKYPKRVIGLAVIASACMLCFLMQKSDMEAQQLVSIVDFYDFDDDDLIETVPSLDCVIGVITRKGDIILQSGLFTHAIEHRRDLGLNLAPTWERGPPPERV